MAINFKTVAKELFNQLVGQGNQLSLFDETGKQTLDPEEAVKFYSRNNKVLVSIDKDKNKIQVKFGPSTDKELVSKFVNVLKNKQNGLARKYILGVDVMPYSNKDIEAKDSVNESLSSAQGSIKTSYQQTEGARLIIKHNTPVNEEIRGSRSRHIKALFIENSQGERFKYPFNHLIAARTMTHHVAQGGNPYDEIGSKIIGLSEEREQLSKVFGYIKKNKIQEQASDVASAITSRLTDIKSLLSKYNPSALAEDTVEENVDDLDQIKEQLTKNVFDEGIAGILPRINGYIKQSSLRSQANTAFSGLSEWVNEAFFIPVTSVPDLAEHELVIYESPTVGTTQLINLIIPVLEDNELQEQLSAVTQYVKQGLVSYQQATTLAETIISKMYVPAQNSTDSVESVMESALMSFDIRELLK